MKNVPENELFSAYLDGEVTAEERAQVERLLATNPEAKQVLESLRTLSATLQSLPVHKLDEDLSQRVLRLAERRMLSESPGGASEGAESPSPHDALQPDDLRWRPSLRRLLRPRNFIFPAAAVAIAVLLTLTERGGMNRPGADRLALAPPAAREEAAQSDVRKGFESSVIGPAPARDRSLDEKAPVAEEEKLRLADRPSADGKPSAEMINSPVVTSSPLTNRAPELTTERNNDADRAGRESAGGGFASSRSNLTDPGRRALKAEPGLPGMAPGAPMAPAAAPTPMPFAMPAAEPRKSAAESLARPAESPASGDVASRGERGKQSAAAKSPTREAKADQVAGEPGMPKADEKAALDKAAKGQAGEHLLGKSVPPVVVHCEVNAPAAARGLLQQVLAKQQIVVADPSRQERLAARRTDAEVGADSTRFEALVTTAQLQAALAELKTHSDVFASCSMEPPAVPTSPAKDAGGAGMDSPKKQAASPVEGPRVAGAPPVEMQSPAGTGMQSLGRNASMPPGFQETPMSLGASQVRQTLMDGQQSQTPLRSQLTQQVTPSQQFPTISSQAGMGQTTTLPQQMTPTGRSYGQYGGQGQPTAKAEWQAVGQQAAGMPGIAQATSADAKQRVVFVFRLTASAVAAEAKRTAASAPTSKAKAAAESTAQPAKPAAAASAPATKPPASEKQ